MSETAPSDSEWRTIRISSATYHRLLELSSFMTLVTLTRAIPLSIVAELAITTFYDTEYPRLKESISDPGKRGETGKEIALRLKRVYDSRDEGKAAQQRYEKGGK